MNFKQSEPEFGEHLRLVSPGGNWVLAVVPANFGRFQVTLGDEYSVEVRYCCGKNQVLTLIVLSFVRKILEPIEEEALTYDDVRRIFPKWTRRPIDLCPECLPRLEALADEAEAKLKGAVGA